MHSKFEFAFFPLTNFIIIAIIDGKFASTTPMIISPTFGTVI